MSEIRVDTISEKSSGNGVAIDSVTLKDGGVTGTAAIVAGGGNGPTLGFQLKDTSGNAQPRLTNDANNDTVIRPGASGRQIMLANYANNATALNVDDSGHVTMPLQPCFAAVPTSSQTNITSGTTIAFGTELHDLNGDFASNTFTSPVNGKYQLNVLLRLEQIDTAYSYFRVYLNTSNRQFEWLFDPNFSADPDYFSVGFSICCDMDASDTATVSWEHGSGSNQVDIAGASTFSGFLVA